MPLVSVAHDATYDDLLAVPPPSTCQLLDGTLVVSARPSFRHAKVAGLVSHALADHWVDGASPGGWTMLIEPELHLGGEPDPRRRVLVPDLAGWRRSRMRVVPDVAASTLPPDFVCEILSPSTGRWDRIVKMNMYAEAGVSWAWLIDPVDTTLEVYELVDGLWRRTLAVAEATMVHTEPFPSAALDLGGWWISQG